ncbi:MAG: hypothetical protein HYV97_18760 [Bdellovibrio sp.]|nr:hypothetical protein [Bdellovibrio sp.]
MHAKALWIKLKDIIVLLWGLFRKLILACFIVIGTFLLLVFLIFRLKNVAGQRLEALTNAVFNKADKLVTESPQPGTMPELKHVVLESKCDKKVAKDKIPYFFAGTITKRFIRNLHVDEELSYVNYQSTGV